jgi:hypothetical protein
MCSGATLCGVRLAALLACLLGASGCFSYALPTLEPVPERALPPDRILYVVPHDPPERETAYRAERERSLWQDAAELAALLDAADTRVRIAATLAEVPPDAAVVQLERGGRRGGECFSDSPVPLITAFVLPHMGCVPFGHLVAVRSRPTAEPVRADTRYQVSIVFGWIGIALNLLPGRSPFLPAEMGEEREQRALRAAIAQVLSGAQP